MIAQQDDQLDRIGDVVGAIRYENQNFSKEVKMQNKMLDKVNNDIDENMENMVKLDGKLKKMLAKSNICCLWIVIIVEIVVFVLLLSQLF